MVFTRKSQNRYSYVTILFFCLNIYPGNQQEYLHLLSSSMKKKSDGLPIVFLPLILYSGNRSKEWNKFDMWCLLLAGLPKNMKSSLENIHFICCSNKVHLFMFYERSATLYHAQVNAIEMAASFSDDLLELETVGIHTYDAYLKMEVVVFAVSFVITLEVQSFLTMLEAQPQNSVECVW